MSKAIKIFGGAIAVICACVIIRQVLNTTTGYTIPYFTFDTFYRYIKGFNGSIITDNIQEAFNTINTYVGMYRNFSFIDAITIIPRTLFMLFNLVLSLVKIAYGVVYFLVYLLGFVTYLFKGYI